MTFIPNLTTLPPPQRALWPERAATPDMFTLYGGTALALRLGHRASVDFDFFSNAAFEPDRLAQSLRYLRGAQRVQVASNTLTCRVECGGPVLVSFFGALGLGQVVDAAEVGDVELDDVLPAPSPRGTPVAVDERALAISHSTAQAQVLRGSLGETFRRLRGHL